MQFYLNGYKTGDPTVQDPHASVADRPKGLPEKVDVLIVGCEEGLLPFARPNLPTDIEEERRLFFVGMTRAQRKLILTSAATRFWYGQRLRNPPSRFLSDIEETLKAISAMAQRKAAPAEPTLRQLTLFG